MTPTQRVATTAAAAGLAQIMARSLTRRGVHPELAVAQAIVFSQVVVGIGVGSGIVFFSFFFVVALFSHTGAVVLLPLIWVAVAGGIVCTWALLAKLSWDKLSRANVLWPLGVLLAWIFIVGPLWFGFTLIVAVIADAMTV